MKLCAAGGVVDFLQVERDLEPEVMDWWVAFNRIDPIGEQRHDLQFAVMTAWLYQAFTGEARSPDDFKCISDEISVGPELSDEELAELDAEEPDPVLQESRRIRDQNEQAAFL